MAAPNLLRPSTITSKGTAFELTTSAQAVINNPASSGKVMRITSLIIANIDGVNSADVTVNYYPQDDLGGTLVKMANTIAVAADAALVVIDKSRAFNLEEDKSIGALASANSDLTVWASWEEIS
jgi:hypothetical protein